jgi:amidase
MERPENLDLLRLTATELQRLLQQKKLSSVELVTQTLARIKKDDKAGLHLNKMISIAPRETLLEAAARLDAERAEGKLRGPLHGITVIIKVS